MVMNWIALTVEDQPVAQEGLVLVVGRYLGRNPRHGSAVPGRDLELDPARPGAHPRPPLWDRYHPLHARRGG